MHRCCATLAGAHRNCGASRARCCTLGLNPRLTPPPHRRDGAEACPPPGRHRGRRGRRCGLAAAACEQRRGSPLNNMQRWRLKQPRACTCLPAAQFTHPTRFRADAKGSGAPGARLPLLLGPDEITLALERGEGARSLVKTAPDATHAVRHEPQPLCQSSARCSCAVKWQP